MMQSYFEMPSDGCHDGADIGGSSKPHNPARKFNSASSWNFSELLKYAGENVFLDKNNSTDHITEEVSGPYDQRLRIFHKGFNLPSRLVHIQIPNNCLRNGG
jgi:hypothetical protein